MIVYASGDHDGLMQVPDVGGVPEPLTNPDPGSQELHLNPHILPGGETVLFDVTLPDEPNQIAALSVESGEYELLTTGSAPHYVEGGFIVFLRESSLWAAAFDPVGLALRGEPVPVVEELGGSARPYALSRDGTLLYSRGVSSGGLEQLVEVDLEGNERALVLAPRNIPGLGVGWSRDGEWIVYSSDNQIYTYNVALGTTPRQLTFEGTNDRPVFSPDGSRVAFSSAGAGTDGVDLFVKDLNDDSPPRPIITLDANQFMMQWPSDTLIVFERGQSGVRDLWMVNISDLDNPIAAAYLSSEADLERISVSPDGTLAAYRSDESGDDEIYVRSFPDPGERTVVSQGGGSVPFWSPDGSTLYYAMGPNQPFMAARLQRDPVPVVLSTDLLFSSRGGREPFPGSALHPDGDRFILALDPATATTPEDGASQRDPLILVQNFFEELRQRMGN